MELPTGWKEENRMPTVSVPARTENAHTPLSGPTRRCGAEDHAAINRRLLRLAQVVEHADFKTIAAIFNEVGEALRAHLDAEERAFPAFEKEHPWEIRRLREDHEAFRRTLDALLVLAELRMLPPETVHTFIRRLRDHARREDASLYAWVEGETDDRPLAMELLAYLHGRLTRKAG